MSNNDKAFMIFQKAGEPVKLDFHPGELGHTVVIAPPGQGMSILPRPQGEIDKRHVGGQ